MSPLALRMVATVVACLVISGCTSLPPRRLPRRLLPHQPRWPSQQKPRPVEKLVMTTGRAMARIQGVPDFPIAVIRHGAGTFLGARDLNMLQGLAEEAARQVENILLGKG